MRSKLNNSRLVECTNAYFLTQYCSCKFVKKMNYLFCRIIYWYRDCEDKMKQKVEESIQQLTIELQTGGNVRYEHGSLSDIWYKEN